MRSYTSITLFIAVLLLPAVTFSAADSLSVEAGNPIPGKMPDSSFAGSIPVTPQITALDSIKRDSLVQDSIHKDRRREFYLSINRYFSTRYQKYPATLDSLYNPGHVYPFRVFQADGMTLADILLSHPAYISVPVTISSHLNRFLFYGLPAAHVALHPDNSLFDFSTDPATGHNLFSAAEIKEIHSRPTGDIRFPLQPDTITKPETSILWESGVFKENILNIRFARPVADNLQAAIFSNFQNFRRQQFSHGSGIYPFYKAIYEGIGLDSSYTCGRGINPLTSEHVSSAALVWNAQSGAQARLSYKYADLHNDLSKELRVIDTLTGIFKSSSLVWEEGSNYIHTVRASAGSAPVGNRLQLFAETMIRTQVNRVSSLSAKLPVRRGESFMTGGGGRACYSIGKDDTLSAALRVGRDERVRHDQSKLVTHDTRPSITYRYGFNTNRIGLFAQATFGYAFIKCNDRLEHIPAWKILVSGSVAGQNVRVYAQQDILPPVTPFDTAFTLFPGHLAEAYQTVGAESFIKYKKIGMIAGVCMINGIDSSAAAQAWPGGVLPYPEPRRVLMVTPLFGEWHGISLSSQWLFSDKKPVIKSTSTLSCHLNRTGSTRHLFVDFGFDYWSRRDSIFYGGIDTWHRPVLDLHARTAVQIKSFRLFYKIDNIFNSKIAYVPGYYMPGLVFRWGFNWLIQG